jgi:hypothetical protein
MASETEIEITAEMIEAGAEAILREVGHHEANLLRGSIRLRAIEPDRVPL